ncbi:hypothetical protein GCM10010174_66250 [Kutzneria viridogrisea]|uniref:Nitroreductase domain-containing protein n=2 Tax=Kutzneria TaxID=43356 RepID=W5W7H8_9PSEU|nr:SagB/ThcOx family dehydrogenase [Kutzneria albida]AHH97113.1 hypothetical protein KALB_3749 [Kutzneria albida DSM 43870]MBA8931916.1 SagB-type dehydrogenase family enzyme [Kutzneria viridogrisea]
MRLRRLRGMTCYWQDGSFVVHCHPGPGPVRVRPAVVEVLAAFDTWSTVEEASEALDHLRPTSVAEAAGTLRELGLLVEQDVEEHSAPQPPRATRILLPRIPGPRTGSTTGVSSAPVALSVLSTLLAQVFGQSELDAYLGVVTVDGVEPGVYHYNSQEHSLEQLVDGFSHSEAARLCAGWPGIDQAAFVVFVTATLDRMWTKYRVSLLDAGRLEQHFALCATTLGLGTCRGTAFDDRAVARRLGIDGVSDVPVHAFAAGVPASEVVG